MSSSRRVTAGAGRRSVPDVRTALASRAGALRRTSFVLTLPGVAASGCDGAQSVWNPAGPQAQRIADLSLFMTIAGTIVYVVVVAVFLAALLRRRRRGASVPDDGSPVPHPPRSSERRLATVVATGAAATVAILLVTLVVSVLAQRGLGSIRTTEALQVDVTGRQWWWEISYLDPEFSDQVTTANELHLPAGRPVRLRLSSVDVIHSLWIPPLHGKKDLIPGYVLVHWIQADEPGIYRGQCAEFCGRQHAHMGLDVVVETPERFAAWLREQRRPAVEPAGELARRGRAVFLQGPCAVCHTVQGTPTFGEVGPDLTHVASRRTLAASTIPNTRGWMAAWILDPQSIKPGAHMPPTTLGSGELQALVAFLEGLR